jgi:RNA recognition motif-containing protein
MALYIGNVDRKVENVDIYDKFKIYGDILDITMHQNYAFLSFRQKDSAEEAIKDLSGKNFFGRFLRVKVYYLRDCFIFS